MAMMATTTSSSINVKLSRAILAVALRRWNGFVAMAGTARSSIKVNLLERFALAALLATPGRIVPPGFFQHFISVPCRCKVLT